MSKLHCPCGHVIHDGTDNLPYKASVTPDANQSKFFDELEDALRRILETRSASDRERWLARFGFTAMYPGNLPSATMAMDLLVSRLISLSKDCYECTECGRLHLQRRGNVFLSYAPDSGRYEGLLRPGVEGTAAGDAP